MQRVRYEVSKTIIRLRQALKESTANHKALYYKYNSRPLRRLLDKYYQMNDAEEIKADLTPIEAEDIQAAIKCCKSTGHGFKKEYEKFTLEYGS